MTLLRILTVALTLIATSLSGAMAAGHGDWQHGENHDMHVLADTEDAQPTCCEDSSDRSSTCHVVPAIEPASSPAMLFPTETRMVPFGAPWTMTGLSPAGLLDPPRRA